jgi:hypothetical protein
MFTSAMRSAEQQRVASSVCIYNPRSTSAMMPFHRVGSCWPNLGLGWLEPPPKRIAGAPAPCYILGNLAVKPDA